MAARAGHAFAQTLRINQRLTLLDMTGNTLQASERSLREALAHALPQRSRMLRVAGLVAGGVPDTPAVRQKGDGRLSAARAFGGGRNGALEFDIR